MVIGSSVDRDFMRFMFLRVIDEHCRADGYYRRYGRDYRNIVAHRMWQYFHLSHPTLAIIEAACEIVDELEFDDLVRLESVTQDPWGIVITTGGKQELRRLHELVAAAAPEIIEYLDRYEQRRGQILSTWELRRGDVLFGILRCDDGDFPTYFGTLERFETFSEIEPLIFDSALSCLPGSPLEEWNALRDPRARGLHLRRIDDNRVASWFAIRFHPDHVSWRAGFSD